MRNNLWKKKSWRLLTLFFLFRRLDMQLYEHQLKALKRMKNGCILCGGTGSGKSITAMSYFYLKNGGDYSYLEGGSYIPMDDLDIKDLYIITTARKRDTFEWEHELIPFGINTNPELSVHPNHKVVIDSWNNVSKYKDVKDAFFIFDEQRVVGSGTWAKTFIKIAKNNEWILLSATPGDKWEDYIPVFIANGFFKNRTEFSNEHLIISTWSKFPMVTGYRGEERLIRLRNKILIPMNFRRETVQHHIDIFCEYDQIAYKRMIKDRWNIFTDEPITTASELCYSLRKLVNSDESRMSEIEQILEQHDRVIIFYNFDYELQIIAQLCIPEDMVFAEYNGHVHQAIPDSEKWVYAVQYTAGCEGWNCTKTDTIIFFSQNYSYKVMKQAIGRIDRLNTMYVDLYYYHLKSKSSIDLAIAKAIKNKKKFNESAWVK